MKILITGASGFIAQNLIPELIHEGCELVLLSRKKIFYEDAHIESFTWGQLKIFPEKVLNNVDVIVHLAGASIAKGWWSHARKKTIINSRVQTAQDLFDAIASANIELKLYISASAIGIYPYNKTKTFVESDLPGNSFLCKVCKMWEMSSLNFSNNGVRTVILRLGSVFASNGGMLKQLIMPVKMGFGATLGKGTQYVPWISIRDVTGFIIFAINNDKVNGPYNLVSPEQVDNNALMIGLRKQLNKKTILPRVPSFMLRIFMGTKSDLVLKGSKISYRKLLSSDYQFISPHFEKTLETELNS